jgi:hypothetical protein
MLLVLLKTDSYSLLPELYDVFGEENLMKFLDIFAGNTIKVPSKKEFSKAIQKIDIYNRLENKKNSTSALLLSQEYEVSVEYIRTSHLEIKKLVENTSSAFLNRTR